MLLDFEKKRWWESGERSANAPQKLTPKSPCFCSSPRWTLHPDKPSTHQIELLNTFDLVAGFWKSVKTVDQTTCPNILKKYQKKVNFLTSYEISQNHQKWTADSDSAPQITPKRLLSKRFWTNVRKFARGELFWDTFPPNIRPYVLSATCSDLHGNSVFPLNQVRRFRIHHQNPLKLRSTKKGFAFWHFLSSEKPIFEPIQKNNFQILLKWRFVRFSLWLYIDTPNTYCPNRHPEGHKRNICSW